MADPQLNGATDGPTLKLAASACTLSVNDGATSPRPFPCELPTVSLANWMVPEEFRKRNSPMPTPSMSHVTDVPFAVDVARLTGLPVTVTNPPSDAAGAAAIQASEPASQPLQRYVSCIFFAT